MDIIKSKAFKFIFLMSLIPYIIVFISGIDSAIHGEALFFGGLNYGFGGFLLGVIRTGYKLFEIPVIPVCIVIEIAYGFRRPILEKISLKTYAVCMIAVCILVAPSTWIYLHRNDIKRYYEKKDAEAMVSQAEIAIAYGRGTTFIGGIYSIAGYEHNTLLIDLDRFEVGFLIGPNEFWKVKLVQTDSEQAISSIKQNYYLQTIIPLVDVGKLITFSTEGMSCNTIAIILEKEDGSTFYVDNMLEERSGFVKYTGLDRSVNLVQGDVKYEDYFSDE